MTVNEKYKVILHNVDTANLHHPLLYLQIWGISVSLVKQIIRPSRTGVKKDDQCVSINARCEGGFYMRVPMGVNCEL